MSIAIFHHTVCEISVLPMPCYTCCCCLHVRCPVCPVWAREHCRISRPPRFLAECRMRQLNQASFVLLYFVLFAFSGLCLVFVVCLFLICLLSCIFQREPTRTALYSQGRLSPTSHDATLPLPPLPFPPLPSSLLSPPFP